MSVCGRCGSIRTQSVEPTVLERILAALRREKVIVCGRCGWRGRVAVRTADDGSRRHHRRRRRSTPDAVDTPASSPEIDFAALDQALARDEGNESA